MNNVRITNVLYFILLQFIGLYFGKERVLYEDSSMALLHITENCFSCYSENRFPILINFFLTHFFALFSVAYKYIVYIQMVNYMVLPVITFYILWKTDNIIYQSAYILGLTFFNYLTFYYPFHDYWVGFNLIYIYFVFLTKGNHTCLINAGINILFIILIFFSHLTLIFPVIFMLLFLRIDNQITKSSFYRTSIMIIFILCIQLTAVFSLNKNSHSAHFITNIQFDMSFLKNLLINITFKNFCATLYTTNLPFSITFLYFIYSISFRTEWKVLLYILMYILSSVLFISFLFPSDGYHIYTEGFFKSFLSVLSIPIVYYVGKNRHVYNIVLLVSLVVVILGGLRVSKRYESIKILCKKANHLKSNIIFKTNQDVCPIEQLNLPNESFFINRIENYNNYIIAVRVKDFDLNNHLYYKFCNTYNTKHSAFFSTRVMNIDTTGFNIFDLSLERNKTSYHCIDFINYR